MLIETERLFLREMTMADYDALYAVLSDPDIMQHYPYTFDEERVRSWIERNINRYKENGFGLWAVCLKSTREMIGDCGLTLQNIEGQMLPEIGYHIRKDCQRKGYAKEAAIAVRDWAFSNTEYPALYSYCKYTNVPSFKTAESIGMHFEKEYPDEANEITHVSCITKTEWKKMNFRKATQDDIDEICQLVKNAIDVMEQNDIHQWDEIYPTKEDFINDLNSGNLFVGIMDNEIAVVFVLNKWQDEAYFSAEWTYSGENFCVIHRLCVNPKFQKQGIAKKTLICIEEKLQKECVKSIRLDVFTENPYALRLYEKAGYHKTGTADWRKGKFLLMEKLLTPPVH